MPYASGSVPAANRSDQPLGPAEHLCDLVDGVSAGTFASAAFPVLDGAMRTDRLSADDREVLSLLAPLLARVAPEHPLIGIVAGMRRLSQVRLGTAQLLVAEIRGHFDDRGIPTLVSGDLGIAQVLYSDPADRTVTMASVLVPKEVSRRERREVVSEAARVLGADLLRGAHIGAERMGVRVVVRSSLARAFGSKTARRRVWGTARTPVNESPHLAPEVLLLESVYRSALGAPNIRWYADAVFALAKHPEFEWDEFADAALDLEWTSPAEAAMRVLAMRGHTMPGRQLPPDHGADRIFWRALDGRAVRSASARSQYRLWLASRLLRAGR